jgi:electron transfer flavoprotein beta subunit
MRARKMDVRVWGIDDLALSKEEVGLDGSPTRVSRVTTPETRGGGEIHEGDPEELARILADYLLGEGAGGESV